MTTNPSSSAPTSTPQRAIWSEIPWILVIGLAMLALLWPLSALTGLGSGAPRALAILGITAVVWIGVVGFGRVAHPILTLLFTGVGYGIVTVVAGLILGGAGAAAWTMVPELLMNALWGCLAGLVAAGIQRLRGNADR